ncbi:MAG: STAS domain-containing protein [Lentisphaeraceae bacterium]|nr:STAS domain-containing protein [Lentisphaeraceae bacterium]
MKLERKNETLHICSDTDITAANTEDIRAQILKEMDDSLKFVELDLKSVELIDSTGISLLISIQNSLAKAEGKLKVLNSSENIAYMFKVMRLNHHFEIS